MAERAIVNKLKAEDTAHYEWLVRTDRLNTFLQGAKEELFRKVLLPAIHGGSGK